MTKHGNGASPTWSYPARVDNLSRPKNGFFLRNPQPRQPLHNLHSLQTHRDDLLNQLDDVLRIVLAVWVVGSSPTAGAKNIFSLNLMKKKARQSPLIDGLLFVLEESSEG